MQTPPRRMAWGCFFEEKPGNFKNLGKLKNFEERDSFCNWFCNYRMLCYRKTKEGRETMAVQRTENEYRSTMICVDDYTDEILTGRLSNPFVEGQIDFRGLMQFLRIMDTMLDEMNFPQSFTVKRTFGNGVPVSEGALRRDTPEPRGSKATFVVRVFFRQNASWQGSILWIEGGREESFRSVLELVLLMHSALEGK